MLTDLAALTNQLTAEYERQRRDREQGACSALRDNTAKRLRWIRGDIRKYHGDDGLREAERQAIDAYQSH